MSIQATNLRRTKPGRSAELLAALQRALDCQFTARGWERLGQLPTKPFDTAAVGKATKQ